MIGVATIATGASKHRAIALDTETQKRVPPTLIPNANSETLYCDRAVGAVLRSAGTLFTEAIT